MKLHVSHPDAETHVVIFNGKPLKHYIVADDVEGYIEIIDVPTMAPIDLETYDDEIDLDEETVPTFTPMASKRIYGEVQIRKLG